MAGGKRASMREGPLSQLFKRTDVDEEPPREQSSRPPDEPQQRSSEAARDEQGLDYAQPRIPTPKERLSTAFGQDIPHDVMERPGSGRAPERQYRPRDEPSIPSASVAHKPVLRVVGVGGA